jgi:folate-binding protein YgfZ
MIRCDGCDGASVEVNMDGELAPDRTVLTISGSDREKFLHGLVTHDVAAPGTGLVWSALLTAQGKYLADFFLLEPGRGHPARREVRPRAGLAQKLSMYKLRADVAIADSGLSVVRGLGDAEDGAFADPRHPALGWRSYGGTGGEPAIDWDAIRVAACVPETGVELIPNDSYILEMGFDRLHGVDHRKGCYVGQEVTARMKHKTELRKGSRDGDGRRAGRTGHPHRGCRGARGRHALHPVGGHGAGLSALRSGGRGRLRPAEGRRRHSDLGWRGDARLTSVPRGRTPQADRTFRLHGIDGPSGLRGLQTHVACHAPHLGHQGAPIIGPGTGDLGRAEASIRAARSGKPHERPCDFRVTGRRRHSAAEAGRSSASKSLASWRSLRNLPGVSDVRFTRLPRCTAGRA